MPTSSTEEREARTVFVGGLNTETDKDHLYRFFSKCGHISEVRWVKDTKTLQAVPGKAFVEFTALQSAKNALDLDGTKLLGQRITINRAADRHLAKKNEDATLFVGNLPFTIDKEEVTNAFAPLGPIKSVRVPYDRKERRPRGFAHVEFENAADAKKGIALNGKLAFDGRKCWIEMAGKDKSQVRDKVKDRHRKRQRSSRDTPSASEAPKKKRQRKNTTKRSSKKSKSS